MSEVLGHRIFVAGLTGMTEHSKGGVVDPKFIDEVLDAGSKIHDQTIKMYTDLGESEMAAKFLEVKMRDEINRASLKEQLKDPEQLVNMIKAQSYQIAGNSLIIRAYHALQKELNNEPEKLFVPEYIKKSLEKDGTNVEKIRDEDSPKKPEGMTAAVDALEKTGCSLKTATEKQTLAFAKPQTADISQII